jgi:hypothetical protein
VILMAVLVAQSSARTDRHRSSATKARRVLLAAITADNVGSAVDLGVHILDGDVSDDAALLLTSGASIILTNVIVFGIWYWELDRGGPMARATGVRPYPDFLFPQMTNPDVAPPGWRPTYVDYLYISLTNVMAFSPSDAVPVARWAKMMLALQATVALATAGLVIARAVNVL